MVKKRLKKSYQKKYIKKPANTLCYKAFYRFLLHTRFYRAETFPYFFIKRIKENYKWVKIY